jgi:hypothetical protein
MRPLVEVPITDVGLLANESFALDTMGTLIL